MVSNKLSKFPDLDSALVVTKLGNSVAYEVVRTKRKRWQIVVINGLPFEYRLLSMLMISYAAGAMAKEMRNMFNDETLDMWRDIGYTHNQDAQSNWDLPIDCIMAIREASQDASSDINLTIVARMISQAMKEVTPW